MLWVPHSASNYTNVRGQTYKLADRYASELLAPTCTIFLKLLSPYGSPFPSLKITELWGLKELIYGNGLTR